MVQNASDFLKMDKKEARVRRKNAANCLLYVLCFV